jgi:hypothetical protein
VVIQLSCFGRAEPSDLGCILPAIAEAAAAVDLDHTRMAAVLDWVQYRRNFRAPVMVRPFGRHPGAGPTEGPLAEIAIDVRRAKDMDYAELVAQVRDRLSKALGIIPDVHECIHLEPWVRPRKSVIWAFNRSYWRHLAAWDATFEKDYASALPGGVSDGTNREFWEHQIDGFMRTLEHLDEWSELPEEIHVLELGVGDGQQAQAWLDTFARACVDTGCDYLPRVRYLMADYSPHVLMTARQRLSDYEDLVECLELDFRNPVHGLGHLRGQVLFAHTCNLYDNLPTDELMRVGERAYEPLVRASITPEEATELAERYGLAESELVATVQEILRHGPEAFGDTERGVRFWSDVWDAVHLEEIYEQILAPAAIRVTPSGDMYLDELLHELPEWTRVHASTVAVESFAQTLALLHHEGVLVAQDLFVRETQQYSSYRGPGKLEGSIVNWLNGPVFKSVGERSGFHVSLDPFAWREGSNTVVLTARQRDAYDEPRTTSWANAAVAVA